MIAQLVAVEVLFADPGPERRQGSRELARRLREAMTRLSPRQAEIFAMRYFEGLGNLEISKMLGATQTSIAVILHRARHRLQKLGEFSAVDFG